MNKAVKLIELTVVLLSIYACDNRRIYEQNIPLAGEKWHKDTVYSFNFTIDNINQAYNLLVNIRNTGSYRYQNLLMFIDLTMPDKQIIRDTLNCILADEKGKWYGKGWGSLWTSTVPYKMNIRFPLEGEYNIKLNHAMRDDNLKALADIGIRIEKKD